MRDKKQIARFGLVGGFNTLLDFGLLFALRAAGLPTISSNIISTTVAFCFSFVANKKFTFKTKGTNVRRELLLFVLVTLFGLWILQTIVISLTLTGIDQSGIEINENVALFAAKIVATIVSLIWNYVMYAKVVFKK